VLVFSLAQLPIGVGASEAPGGGPRSPREEQATFKLTDPALAIELIAAEPYVTSPVAIAWDEDGRLYVAEMIDYPTAPTSGRIRRLEDRDGDGRYEQATVFADGLPFPNGVMPCFGGVLATAAPNIWFLRDDDGDGRADLRRLVLTGFGEGNTQLRVNGLYWGLDNWIYAANGRSDGEIRAPADAVDKAVSIRRRDVRFRMRSPGPGGGAASAVDVEAIAGCSQFGLAHDDWGNRFPSWNTIPIQHVALEQQTLDRNPYLAETASVAAILDMADGGRIFSLSPAQARFNRESVAFFNASCGPIVERGGFLGQVYHGNAFVCEPLSNLVHRRVLDSSGVTFIARRVEQGREFLAASDPAFRPVNLAIGPDGALYVVDMYRELVEHPQFVPESARATVDFRRWHDRGRIWRIRAKDMAATGGRNPNLSQASVPELTALLGHPNGWWRMTAQRLLVERRDRTASRLLVDMLENDRNALARLHALWTLVALNGLDAAIMNRVAGDEHPALREHALRVASALEPSLPKRLISTASAIKLAHDPAMRVRLQAAILLGSRCRDEPASLDAMATIAAQDADDPWMRLAILSGLAESSLAFIPLCERVPPGSGRAQLLSQAAAIVGVRRRTPELATLLAMIAAGLARAGTRAAPSASIGFLTMLAGLAEGMERSGPPLRDIIHKPPSDLKSDLDRIAPLWQVAADLAASSQPAAQRLVALDVVARGRPDLARAIIPDLLAVTQPAEIQLAAARAVARAAQPELASKALDRWKDLALGTRRELALALAGSPVLSEPLIVALEQHAIDPGELDATSRDALQRLPNAAQRQRAAAVLARFALPVRSAAVARYQAALKLEGDARRGAAVFARNCQTCHQHGGAGHRVGPDLSGIAGRAPEALLIDVLDPNREVAPDYMTLAIATRRGQIVTGLLAEESTTTLKLRRAEAIEETVLRSEIDELRATGRSLMPEGLEQAISLPEMADLIAFLRQGK
jgi:putative membrane-bound dehydrogenase-like protein